jgi:hypothetical protein
MPIVGLQTDSLATADISSVTNLVTMFRASARLEGWIAILVRRNNNGWYIQVRGNRLRQAIQAGFVERNDVINDLPGRVNQQQGWHKLGVVYLGHAPIRINQNGKRTAVLFRKGGRALTVMLRDAPHGKPDTVKRLMNSFDVLPREHTRGTGGFEKNE